MKLGTKHKCPACGKTHQAFSELCRNCRNEKEYEIIFADWRDKERFEDTQARIRHEEKILREKGQSPNQCLAATADRILRKNRIKTWTMDE